MREHYLSILELGNDATEKEIKKKYRSLVKKYHPDINNDPTATEKFLEIDKAYEYLTRKKSNAYTEVDSEDSFEVKKRQERVRKARERAWKKRQEELKVQKSLLHFFSYLIIASAIANISFLVDMCLPKETINEILIAVRNVDAIKYKGNNSEYEVLKGGTERYHEMLMEEHSIIVSDKQPLPSDKHVRLTVSKLYGFSEAITYDGTLVPVHFSLYRIFDVVVYILLISAGLFFYFRTRYEFRFGLVALTIVLTFMQILVATT